MTGPQEDPEPGLSVYLILLSGLQVLSFFHVEGHKADSCGHGGEAGLALLAPKQKF